VPLFAPCLGLPEKALPVGLDHGPFVIAGVAINDRGEDPQSTTWTLQSAATV
jgi:hypothetical protein